MKALLSDITEDAVYVSNALFYLAGLVSALLKIVLIKGIGKSSGKSC